MRFRLNEKNIKFVLVAPAIVILLAVAIYPTVFSLYLAFCSWELTGGPYAQIVPVFTGLKNFERLLQDHRFWRDVQTTVSFVVSSVGLEFLIGLGLALILNTEIRGRKYWRVIFLVPMMMTPVAVGYTWRMMYHMERGPLNYLLSFLFIPAQNWMGDRTIALFSCVLMDVWEWTPFMILVLLAGLQSIPVEPYEAAIVDGASKVQIFRYVTFPLLYPVIVVGVLLRALEAFKVFDIIYVTTAGGPALSTEAVTLYVQIIGLRELSLGYASAVAYVLLIMVIALTLIFISWMRRRG